MTKEYADILRANRYTTDVWEQGDRFTVGDGRWMVQFTLNHGKTTVVINTDDFETALILLRKNVEIIGASS